jgi:hypothetical protein
MRDYLLSDFQSDLRNPAQGTATLISADALFAM